MPSLLLALIAAVAGCSHTEPGANEKAPREAPAASPIVTLRTAHGDLVIEVAPSAAPEAIARWLRLVEEASPESDAGERGTGAGYYDGLAFTYTHPHVEIVTEVRQQDSGEIELPAEIDAVSLGLDRKIIQDRAEAMKVLQWEVIRAHSRMGKGEDRPDLLKEWIGEWRATGSADFLIGESWQRVYEALGYEYRRGLQSLPVTAGAVALRPVSTTAASMRLSIAIADMPQRTGRWMVIGRVVEGLEAAEEISVRKLKGQGTPEAKNFEPLDPVVIDRVDVVLDP